MIISFYFLFAVIRRIKLHMSLNVQYLRLSAKTVLPSCVVCFFLPRDTMRIVRYMLSQSVRLSLSDTIMFCVQTVKQIAEILSPRDILVFSEQILFCYKIGMESSIAGALNAGEVSFAPRSTKSVTNNIDDVLYWCRPLVKCSSWATTLDRLCVLMQHSIV